MQNQKIIQNYDCRMKNANDLRARTKKFALDVIGMYAALPKTTLAMVLGKQVLRSGTSVGANYREADRARSSAEFIAKLGDCLKELDESAYWFELLSEGRVMPCEKLSCLTNETNELIAIFVTIIKNTRKNHAKK
jgi:four helix bundle protein